MTVLRTPGGTNTPAKANEAGSLLVAGNAYRSTATITRPANTTAYTANDVMGAAAAAFELTNVGPAGAHVMFTSVDIMGFVSAVPSGMTGFYLHLYDATPPSAPADNAAFNLPSGDRANYLGYIDIGTPLDLGDTIFAQATLLNQQFKLASGQTSLWGVLQTKGAFTPAGNSEQYQVRARTVAL